MCVCFVFNIQSAGKKIFMRKSLSPSLCSYLTSLAFLSLNSHLLASATVSISSDNGTGAFETLSAAINTVNGQTDPFFIQLNVSPSLVN